MPTNFHYISLHSKLGLLEQNSPIHANFFQVGKIISLKIIGEDRKLQTLQLIGNIISEDRKLQVRLPIRCKVCNFLSLLMIFKKVVFCPQKFMLLCKLVQSILCSHSAYFVSFIYLTDQIYFNNDFFSPIYIHI